MTRSQLILGTALLVVSGTVAFTTSYRSQSPHLVNPQTHKRSPKIEPSKDHPKRLRSHKDFRTGERAKIDDTYYEISVARDEDRERALIIEQDSRDKLEKLTNRYDLTPMQRREIFPIIAGFHPNFREGMLVNGQSVPHSDYRAELNTSAYAFEEFLHPIFDPIQQELLEIDVESKTRWWEDVKNQLETDLQLAIETGEMVPIPPLPTHSESDQNEDPTPLSPSKTPLPTEGDSEATSDTARNFNSPPKAIDP